MILEGPRLRLRPWQAADWAPLAALNADPVAMRYFAAPLSRAESDAWGARLQAHIATHGWGFWAVERREAPGCIGAVGLMHIPWQVPGLEPGAPAVEIGWRWRPASGRSGWRRSSPSPCRRICRPGG
jgi:RimJ/RimL family protein N-acetyltransferase